MDKNKVEEKIEELNEKITELEELLDFEEPTGIKDLDNFIWKLKLENLYDEKLEKFINDYMRFYNE